MTQNEWGEILYKAATIGIIVWFLLFCGFNVWAGLTQF